MMSSYFRVGVTLCASIVFSGCEILPASGPASMDVRGGQTDVESLSYAIVKITPEAVDILEKETPRLSTAFSDRRPPKDIVFGVGDILSVTIFEAAAGGLFIPAEAACGRAISSPFRTRRSTSTATSRFPMRGSIRREDAPRPRCRTPSSTRSRTARSSRRSWCRWSISKTSMISVLGEWHAVAIPATASRRAHARRDHARAVARKSPGYDTWVMLEREGRQATAPFGALVYEPANNVYVHPNDTIYLYREPQTFVAFGAVRAPGTIARSAPGGCRWRRRSDEAGGLNDSQADPASVFLYRGEAREVAERLGIDFSPYEGPVIPVIYNDQPARPRRLFPGESFEMRNKDILYVSNSVSVESAKAMSYFRLLVATANDPIIAASGAAAVLKGLLHPRARA